MDWISEINPSWCGYGLTQSPKWFNPSMTNCGGESSIGWSAIIALWFEGRSSVYSAVSSLITSFRRKYALGLPNTLTVMWSEKPSHIYTMFSAFCRSRDRNKEKAVSGAWLKSHQLIIGWLGPTRPCWRSTILNPREWAAARAHKVRGIKTRGDHQVRSFSLKKHYPRMHDQPENVEITRLRCPVLDQAQTQTEDPAKVVLLPFNQFCWFEEIHSCYKNLRVH